MPFYDEAITGTPEYATLLSAVRKNTLPAAAAGLSYIHKAFLISNICRDTGKTGLVIVPSESEGRRFCEDLGAFGALPLFYPLRDYEFFENSTASLQYEQERTGVLSRILSGDFTHVVLCADALMQYTLSPKVLGESVFEINVGDEIAPDDILRRLIASGYVSSSQIEAPGQFSRRGGILDVFSPDSDYPVRIEFFGDTVDSMSFFDIASQRSTDSVDFVHISPACEVLFGGEKPLYERLLELAGNKRRKISDENRKKLTDAAEKLKNGLPVGGLDRFIPLTDKRATVFDYVGDSLVFVCDMSGVRENAAGYSERMRTDIASLFESGVLFSPLDDFYMSENELFEKLSSSETVCLDTFSSGGDIVGAKTTVSFTALQSTPWSGDIKQLCEDIRPLIDQNYACVLLGGNEKGAMLISEDLRSEGLPARYEKSPVKPVKGIITVTRGALSAGFQFPETKIAVITHGYVTNKAKSVKKAKNKNSFNSLDELKKGDYVVHSVHGIGVFMGIKKIVTSGVSKDYITISYAGSDTLYVPVTQLDLVSKYIGASGGDVKIKLNKLGGTEWQRSKKRVRAAVRDMAKELIALYSARMNTKGYAFSPDTDMQNDFERRFEFEETADQLRCIDEIKADMQRDVPMERLLCGDVGFGKTEVALRAAFKCISEGKQCAILVPTTILAWQHYQTVLRRMQSMPVNVGLLSRFVSTRQQNETIAKLRRGECDIVIGTHRLLSKDIKFKDLGLMIVDEEQRFGVAQKERLKEMFKAVDVLTLSATPIPRTLNMVMSGIRDMSVIEDPPRDRQPVQTFVTEYNSALITEAVRRELSRGGQVYYLHNRIEDIERVAASLKMRLGDQVRIQVAHGAMSEEALSDVWRQLVDGEIDVLVCTTIIETGVDVPNVNTLIIENADCMGLSQLHQLRGRVGRSPRRAYAYLTYRAGKALSEVSEKRLTALREFTQFGSGLKIAMRDLEIRGAGDLLGAQQHGQMETVGYDMYLKLLEDAVKLERGEQVEEENECMVDMQLDAHIPESYLTDLSQRLYMYRRIAEIRSEDDILDVTDELIDRYGEPPKSVSGLMRIALLRSRAAQNGIYEISQRGDNLIVYSKPFDGISAAGVASLHRGRVLINAGTKPYISFKIAKGQSPDGALCELLDALDTVKKLKNEESAKE